jgi:hypothetical protein
VPIALRLDARAHVAPVVWTTESSVAAPHLARGLGSPVSRRSAEALSKLVELAGD